MKRPPPPDATADRLTVGARVEFDNDRPGEPATLTGVVEIIDDGEGIIRLDPFTRDEPRTGPRTVYAVQVVPIDQLKKPARQSRGS